MGHFKIEAGTMESPLVYGNRRSPGGLSVFPPYGYSYTVLSTADGGLRAMGFLSPLRARPPVWESLESPLSHSVTATAGNDSARGIAPV